MQLAFHAAALEQGLGFFTLDPATLGVTWEGDTARALGAADGGERLTASLRSGLRSYLPAALAAGSTERLRCIAPVGGSAVELVVLPPEPGRKGREGFFFPYPLHLPLETMRRYVLANVWILPTLLRMLRSSVPTFCHPAGTALRNSSSNPFSPAISTVIPISCTTWLIPVSNSAIPISRVYSLTSP